MNGMLMRQNDAQILNGHLAQYRPGYPFTVLGFRAFSASCGMVPRFGRTYAHPAKRVISRR